MVKNSIKDKKKSNADEWWGHFGLSKGMFTEK